MLHNALGSNVPKVDKILGPRIFKAVSLAISDGFILSCHDCSEGGIAVALAEMCLAGEVGAEVDISRGPKSPDVRNDYEALFSESNSRFILEVKPKMQNKLEKLFSSYKIPFSIIGETVAREHLQIKNDKKDIVLDEAIKELKNFWKKAEIGW